jgi:hypothetical protein
MIPSSCGVCSNYVPVGARFLRPARFLRDAFIGNRPATPVGTVLISTASNFNRSVPRTFCALIPGGHLAMREQKLAVLLFSAS